MSIPKIQEIENSLEWKKINSTNIKYLCFKNLYRKN